MTLLIVTAVAAERDALLAGLGSAGVATDEEGDAEPTKAAFHVLVGGVGIAAAAARTARHLTQGREGQRYGAVLSAGIAGAYPGRASIGSTVIGARSVAADLGAESPDGFLTVADLGFGTDTLNADPDLVDRIAALIPRAARGAVLSVSTVTGTASRAADLIARHPDAVAEGMEGWGVATAADLFGVPFAELRTVSNLVGPRDRAAWRIRDALGALQAAGEALATLDE
jgi:futalosine hydrolase